MERRLAAILAADMVGYSRLMAADEAGTIARQKAHRAALIDPKITEFGGRIVKTTGDGMLVEFPSVLDAVQCAVDIQLAMPEREAEVPEDQRIRYRVGINLGDIVIDGDDILGDGVNIAARLEGLSEPEGLCISDLVYQNVLGKLGLRFEDLGEQALKNMERKVRVWRWAAGVDDAAAAARRPPRPSPLTDKPSIAVLPFENMSGDPEQEYFADGLAEDIITELSREPDLLVIARNSSFAYKGQTKDITEIGRDLGARYLLEGSLRKAGNRIRLTAQLIDAETNHHLWAERYDRSLEDVFEVQDELTSAIYSTLLKKFIDIGLEQTGRRQPTDLDAYQLVLRASGLLYRMTRADCDAGFEAAEAALALDPHYARAHTALAWAHIYRVFLGQAEDPKQALETARAEAQKAIEADRNDYWSYGALGGAELWLAHHDRALSAVERAVALAPTAADMRALRGLVLNYCGRSEEALADVEMAVRLNPHHPDWYLMVLGRALYNLGRHEAAVVPLQRLVDSGSQAIASYLLLIANYVALGRSDEARDAVAAILKIRPEFRLANVPPLVPIRDREELDSYVAALRQAGLPE